MIKTAPVRQGQAMTISCLHSRRALRGDSWVCRSCGNPEPARVEGRFRGAPEIFVAGDPNEIQEGHRLRNRRHDPRLSGFEIERRYGKHVEKLRDMKRHGALRRGDEDMRLAARIPGELFFAKQRQDKKYWLEGDNLRKHKAFLVDD